MKKSLIVLALLFPLFIQAQETYTLESPSKKLCAKIEIKGVHASAYVEHQHEALMEVRTLQFDFKQPMALKAYHVIAVEKKSVDQTWTPLYGTRKEVPDVYNEIKFTIQETTNEKELYCTFRLYDEGLAYQYAFNKVDFGHTELTAEQSQFLFPENYTTWVTKNAQGMYQKMALNEVKEVVDRPQVIQCGNCYVAIGEAALVDYSRMKLEKSKVGFGVQSALSGTVQLDRARYHSPWRYVLVGDTPGSLVEQNYLIENLNEPCQIKNTSWIKPGKAIREVTLSSKGAMACIDFAAQNGISYVEFDAGWYGNEYKNASDASTVTLDPKRSTQPFDMPKIIAYANEKHIGIILYVNMRALAKQLDQILPLYKEWGIKGLKYGFVDVGDQEATSWLHLAVRKAAKYEMMVDIHDEYRPTGYSRTYPNLMTQEGIRGDEETPSVSQSICTLYNRSIAGAADNTNCFFAERVSAGKMGGKAAQMAKEIAIYSPWQFVYWYDRPKSSVPEVSGAGNEDCVIKEEIGTEFYKAIPTVWDDTRFLQGEIGEQAVVARKTGSQWYVGALNAHRKRTQKVETSFLDVNQVYEVTAYYQTSADLKKNKVRRKSYTLKKGDVLSAELEANSGCVWVLTKKSF